MEYATDEANANEKYKDQHVLVSGELYYIGESHGGEPMILFRSPESVYYILGGYFDAEFTIEPTIIVKGITIAVEGKMREKAFGSIIEISATKIIPIL